MHGLNGTWSNKEEHERIAAIFEDQRATFELWATRKEPDFNCMFCAYKDVMEINRLKGAFQAVSGMKLLLLGANEALESMRNKIEFLNGMTPGIGIKRPTVSDARETHKRKREIQESRRRQKEMCMSPFAIPPCGSPCGSPRGSEN